MITKKKKIAIISLLLATVMIATSYVRINISQSLPFWVFFSRKKTKIERNAFVSFSRPENSHLLVKQVMGLPGDKIEHRSEDIFVNGRDCGKLLSKTPSGKRVSPLTCDQIPDGYLFVSATHPESFDSRYQEFGLVQIEEIEEVLWPVF